MGITDWILGRKLDDGGKCAWCSRPIGEVPHAPIPVCAACYGLAHANGRPDGPHGNLWEKLMRQFPMEARTGVRNTQHRPSAQDFSVQVTEAQMDIIGLQHKAMRHRRAGEVAEAMDLEAQIARRLADIAVFKSGLAGMVDALGKEGGS